MNDDTLAVLGNAREFTAQCLEFMELAKPRILELQQYAHEVEAALIAINERIAQFEAHQAKALTKLKRIAEVMELFQAMHDSDGEDWKADSPEPRQG